MATVIWITSSPLSSVADNVHTRYKKEIIDRNVYDTSAGCYPAVGTGYTFGLSGATSNVAVQIVHNGESVQSLIGSSSYQFKLVPIEGRNDVYAVQSGVQSNQLVFTTDILQTLVFPFPLTLRDREDEVRQGWANGYLSTGNVVSANSVALVPTMRALIDTWGNWLDASVISGYTSAQYIALLQTVLGIYKQGAVAKSMSDVGAAIGGSGSLTGSSTVSLIKQISTIGIKQPLVYGSGTTGVTVTAGKVYLNNRGFNVPFISHLPIGCESISNQVEATGDVFVTVDLSLSNGNSSGNVTPVVTNLPPSSVMANYFDEFGSSRIQTDIDGVVTGMENGKYIVLDNIATAIVSITGSPYQLLESSRILLDYKDRNTAFVDLGTRLDIDELVTGTSLGVTYRAPRYNTKVLSRVVCALLSTANTVTGVTDVRNVSRPGHGAMLVPSGKFNHAYSVYINKEDELDPHTESEKEFASSILTKLAPIGGNGYLYFNKTPARDPYTIQSSGNSFVFWLRAKSITGTAHGEELSTWDSEITGITATGVTSYLPTYITGATPNGRPVVRFGGIDGTSPASMDLPLFTLSNRTGFTIFSVNKNNYTRCNDKQVVFFASGPVLVDQTRAQTFRVSSGQTSIGLSVKKGAMPAEISVTAVDNIVAPTKFSVDCSVFDYLTGQINQYQNGVLVGNGDMGVTGATSVNLSSAVTLSTTGTTAFYGDIAEIIGIDGALPSWAVRQISNWLYRINLAPNLDIYNSYNYEYYGEI